MPTQTLQSLPSELLRHIFLHADAPTLTALSETCHFFHHTLQDETLWRTQTRRRFRVSPRVAQCRRLQAAGHVSWRALYAQWHMHMRMPASRVSGANHVAFAKGGARGALVWVTVASTEDCRLVLGKLKLRVVVQNVWGGAALQVTIGKGMEFQLTDGVNLRCEPGMRSTRGGAGVSTRRRSGTADDKSLPFQERVERETVNDYRAYVKDCFVERAEGRDWAQHHCVLRKDDFAVLTVEVQVPGARFEVDALERLENLCMSVARVGCTDGALVARFHDRVLWDSYERLPGGWWVRKDASNAHLA